MPAAAAGSRVSRLLGQSHLRPRRGGISSQREGPHLLPHTPWHGREHAKCLPEVVPRKAQETQGTQVHSLPPSPLQVQAFSMGKWEIYSIP